MSVEERTHRRIQILTNWNHHTVTCSPELIYTKLTFNICSTRYAGCDCGMWYAGCECGMWNVNAVCGM